MLSEDHGCISPTAKTRKPLVFRLNENGVGPEVIREVLLDRGWEEFSEGETEEYDWNLWWRTNRFRLCDYDDLMPWQRLNHFPKTNAITKKDALARNMRRMKGVYGNAIYNFMPDGFNLPNDYTKFVAEYSKSQRADDGEASKRSLWICKPADLSRGRGIFIFQDLSDLTYDCSAVVQKYITNPLLIGGYKFDLRIYVLVTSFNPLHIYMYKEGIVRFSTEKFDLSSLGNMFCHLTNTSINKLGPSYTAFKEGVGPGCKWSLTMLRNYFHQQGIDDEVLWQKVCNIVTLSMLAQAQTVPKTHGCVELFGYDILIDEKLKPWLLEVNFSPALGLDCAVDNTIKSALINDMIDLMHFQKGDETRGGDHFTKLKQRQAYMHGSTKRANLTNLNNGRQRGSPVKPTVKNKPPSRAPVSSPSKLNRTGPKGALSKVPSKNSFPSNERLALQSRAGSGGSPSVRTSSQKESTCDLEDDYDEEIAAACAQSSSEALVKDGAGSAKGRYTSIASSTGPIVKPGSALNNLSLPSLEEARKKLNSRRELIRSRQDSSKQARPSSSNGKHPTSQPSSADLLKSRSATQASMSSSKSQSYLTASSSRASNVANSNLREPRGHTHAGSIRRGPVSSSSNSQVQVAPTPPPRRQGQGQDASFPRKTPSRQAFTRTGLKLGGAREGAPSIMNEKGASNNKPKTRDGASSHPPQTVGDFMLTFPFNEATRRASSPSLDMRTIIRQVQKALRRAMLKAHSTKQLTHVAANGHAATQRAADKLGKQHHEDHIVQWVPLKSQTLLSGQ